MKVRFLRSSSPRPAVSSLRLAHESLLLGHFVTLSGSPEPPASSRKFVFYAFRHLVRQFRALRELMKVRFFRISSPRPAISASTRAHESSLFSHFVTSSGSTGHKTGWDWLKNLIGCRPLDAKTQQEVLQKSV